MPVKVCHIAVAKGVFAQLMGELGIEKPDDAPKMDGLKIDWFKYLSDLEGKKRKGTSTLKKWWCPECGMNVRIGIAGDPMLRLHTCEKPDSGSVILAPGDVYVAKK